MLPYSSHMFRLWLFLAHTWSFLSYSTFRNSNYNRTCCFLLQYLNRHFISMFFNSQFTTGAPNDGRLIFARPKYDKLADDRCFFINNRCLFPSTFRLDKNLLLHDVYCSSSCKISFTLANFYKPLR